MNMPFGLDGNMFLKNKVDEFDSAQSEQIKDKLSPMQYKALIADISNIRTASLGIALDVVDAITSGELDGETPSDYLDGLIHEAVGLDGDEDIDNVLYDIFNANIADAFSSLGVDDSSIEDMFSDDTELADAAIEASCETAVANLPDAGEDLDEFCDNFVFGYDDADVLDETVEFDAVEVKKSSNQDKAKNGALSMRKVGGKRIGYKGVAVIRNGKRTIVNKRLPNQKIRLSSGQKQALKKANRKAQTPNAIRQRVKSWKKGKKMGLY